MTISVEDHIAIQRLMFDYARCADAKDYAGFREIFRADAVFEFMGRSVEGIAAIEEMMHNLEKYKTTQHQIHNILYDVEGDSASGETYCLASHLADIDGREMKIDMGIRYGDELSRTAAGWRIARRDFNLLWTQTAPTDA